MLREIAKACLNPIYKVQHRLRPCRFLFVVGHMRSGSTLLTHILNTNEAITGYGETHIRYRSEGDLVRLVQDVFPTRRTVFLTRYVMDKILHNEYLCESVINRNDCYFIYLIRDPTTSIRSMMRQFPTWFGPQPLDRETLLAKATDHYCSRLATIEREAAQIGDKDRTMFLTYESFLGNTRRSLGAIQQSLGLSRPLSEDYELMRTTGLAHKGDPSQHIMKGKIDRSIMHDDIPVDADWLREPERLFERVSSRLASLCSMP